MSFQAGQVVVVRSGGPRMTVVEVQGDNLVCSWMEQKGKAYVKKQDTFPAVMLADGSRRAAMPVRFG